MRGHPLMNSRRTARVSSEIARLLPSFAAGAALATAVGWILVDLHAKWLIGLAAAGLYVTYRTYRVYAGRIDAGQQHARELADLHLATIEALALAIDAKDRTCQTHLRRVQLYATSVARAMGMSAGDVQGVETAALLHDIGKLAVPEHILSKPGPLTAEEFQKIRAHPKVGADIVSSVPFPYPVAPLILSHHERWDGKGYPAGLKGAAIPLGARILSVVDYFDALLADRPYHKAMTRAAAVQLLQQEAGRALDPAVVSVFLGQLPSLELEAAALERTAPPTRSDRAAGGRPAGPRRANVLEDIALAHREIYVLYDMAKGMGASLSLPDTLGMITGKLSNLVPYSCGAVFLLDEGTDTLRCHFATGTDAEFVQQVVVRTGDGLTGWVARNRRPLVNARPQADFEAAGVPSSLLLQSALVCPLLVDDRCIGTLSLYHVDLGFFLDDHRRLLDRVSEQASAVINNALVFEQTQEDSLTDALTGLPNTRFLYMHLSRELARAGRLEAEVAVMLMDLDGFKEINDTHGHHVGDRALVDVARTLRAGIRPYDICVRYAGDEFIVVLPGCSMEEAEVKRAELQRSIGDLAFDARPGLRLQLGISVGIAVFSRDGDSYETLLATADGRMYQDKAGRKRRPSRETTDLLNADA
jgi:diguanylate cyclase (GGDEF)-like protein/putative nucleotidyltransferase with HDIG domain